MLHHLNHVCEVDIFIGKGFGDLVLGLVVDKDIDLEAAPDRDLETLLDQVFKPSVLGNSAVLRVIDLLDWSFLGVLWHLIENVEILLINCKVKIEGPNIFLKVFNFY